MGHVGHVGSGDLGSCSAGRRAGGGVRWGEAGWARGGAIQKECKAGPPVEPGTPREQVLDLKPPPHQVLDLKVGLTTKQALLLQLR